MTLIIDRQAMSVSPASSPDRCVMKFIDTLHIVMPLLRHPPAFDFNERNMELFENAASKAVEHTTEFSLKNERTGSPANAKVVEAPSKKSSPLRTQYLADHRGDKLAQSRYLMCRVLSGECKIAANRAG